ncbi:917_t:CDS:2, partial [Acaulospora morrowiae]
MASRTSRTSRRQSREINPPEDAIAGASVGVDISRPWSLPPVVTNFSESEHWHLY